jgi:hypothetical protein
MHKQVQAYCAVCQVVGANLVHTAKVNSKEIPVNYAKFVSCTNLI